MVGLRVLFGTLGHLFQFFWMRRLWWLIPVVVLVLLFAVLSILGTTLGIGPFIYVLF